MCSTRGTCELWFHLNVPDFTRGQQKVNSFPNWTHWLSHWSIWFRVLYLSMCAWVLFPSPRHSAVHTHMSCHACNPGPWLRFSLYTAAPDPGENYRQWSSTLCLSLTHRAQAVALMWPVTSASYVAAVAEQQLLLSLSVHLLQVPSL